MRPPLALFVGSSLAVVTPGAAEQLPVRSLTTAEGLPRDQLACVASDERGFVWFCTDDGLARFDGHNVETFSTPERGGLHGLRSFFRTHDGRYFVGYSRGLMQFVPAAPSPAGRFVPVQRPDRRESAVNAIAEGRDGTVWCGTGDGLFRVSQTKGVLTLVEVPIGLPRQGENDSTVKAVLEDDQGGFWVGAGSGLYRRDPDGRASRFTTADGLPADEVRALALDERHRLWAATREGLALIDRQRVGGSGHVRIVERAFRARDGLPASNVHSLLAAGDRLWVGTVLGVAALTLDDKAGASVSSVVRGFYAWGLAQDARGDLWVATESGARRVVRGGLTTFTLDDGLPALRISSIFEARDGRPCVVSLMSDVELSCFDERGFHRISIGALRPGTNPGWGWSQIAFQDRHRGWWIPTGDGLIGVGPTSVEGLASAPPVAVLTARDGLRSNDVFRVFEDSLGGVWIATYAEPGNGISRVDPKSGRVQTYGSADGLPGDLPILHAFAEDRSGQMWVGLEQGLLLRQRAGRFETILSDTTREGRPLNAGAGQLRALLVDTKGRLWIASTAAGLGRIDDPRADHPKARWYGKAQDLSSDTVWSIAEHPSGDLYLGTGGGVDRFNPESGRVVRYGAEDGLPRGEVLGSLRDHQGRIWFATTAGLARLVPLDVPVPEPPATFVSAVRVNGAPLNVSAVGESAIDGISLRSDDSRLEIDYVSPGSREADGLRYQYVLEGADRDWGAPTERRSVVLAGVAPGRYRFQVRSLLPGRGEGVPASVSFEVLAPVWRRGWFLGLAALAAGLPLVAAYRARVARAVAVERVRTRIAADLHDDVGASLSRIAILSEVVRSQVEALKPDAAPLLGTIAEEARTVVDQMGDVVWLVDPRLDTLDAVVARLRIFAADLFEASRVSWSLEAPRETARVDLRPEHRRHLYLILKESLTNVLRHARAEHATVRISDTRGRLVAEVTDDGAGIDPGSPAGSAGGHGIANMRARTAELGGTLSITAGPGGRGTRVGLEFPWRRHA